MTEQQAPEAARGGVPDFALSTADFINKPDLRRSTGFNGVARQLAEVDQALTALEVASERAVTAPMLERLNCEWDALDARIAFFAGMVRGHERWTRQPVDTVYERLHRLFERGLGYEPEAGQEAGGSRELEEQFRRLVNRLLVHRDHRVPRNNLDTGTQDEDLTGRNLGGFVLGELIAEGGYGKVYRCEQTQLHRGAVVKVLHERLSRRDIPVQRFLREARLASKLDHPYAAHVYAFGIEPDGLIWIAMERVHGDTLAEWLKAHGPMPLGEFVAFFERIATVVHTAHERGIVHRDLKPANVMVIERAGERLPKLLDLGVAKLLEGAALSEDIPDIDYSVPPPTAMLTQKRAGVLYPSGPETITDPSARLDGDRDRKKLTLTNDAVGSPAYMSPEQCSNAGMVGPASDLYSLGVVAFEALTGRLPFEGTTRAEYVELHRKATVPVLGERFSPALDRFFQRALAKRPEDRWGTALELAGALRAASGVGITRADLPRIDPDVRDAWVAGAPQPLAESMAELDGAHNANQARDIADGLVRTLLRYLLAMTLALNARVQEDHGDPALLELVRALNSRALGFDERVQLFRLLVRRLMDQRDPHAVPELLELVTRNSDGADSEDALDPILARYTAAEHAVTEDAVRAQFLLLIPELTVLLRKAAFVLDYVLVVPRNHTAERWTGRRRQERAVGDVVDGDLVEGHPMLLDRAGRVCVDLWPLVQALPLLEGAEPELLLFDGHGRRGALLIAAPSGREHHDAIARNWVATNVIAEIEIKTRMRDQIRVAAQTWQDWDRAADLLWRGDALANLEHWMRQAIGVTLLSEAEEAFVAASRRAGRRARWSRRLLAAAPVVIAAAAVAGYVALKVQAAEMSVTQAEVGQGRQALLHDDTEEAKVHLSEAYRRGDHSLATKFMLARALQPSMAEQARFAATAGRMWSAAFSPDGRQIVTTDDASARIWDARTNGLLFTLPHGNTVYHAVYSADGTRLVTASADGSVKLWDPASGTLLRKLTHDGTRLRYYAAAISPDGKFIAAIDLLGTVANVWDAASGARLAELPNDASGFPSIAFSATGRWLATSGGNDVRVFETGTWSQATAIAGPRIHTLSFDPVGPWLATGSANGDTSIWEIPSGTRVRHLRESGDAVSVIAFSPDGQLLAVGGRGVAVQVWRATTGALQSQFNAPQGVIAMVEFDPAARLVLAAGGSGTVAVADAALGMLVTTLGGPRGIVRTAHFDPSSRRVIGASWDGTARVWDATSPYRRWSSPPVANDCDLVGNLEPDGRFVAIGCRDLTTRVWDTARNQLVADLPSVTPVPGDFASAGPAIDVGGDRAAIARGNTVEIYELPGGRLLHTIRHGAPVNAVAFGPAGHDLVSGAIDGSLLVTHDDLTPLALPPSSGGVDAAAILPDGRVVAVDARSRLRFYDPDHNTLLIDLETPTRVQLLRVSPDGSRLITIPSYTGNAAPALLWDLAHYRRIAQLEGYTGHVLSARFTAHGIMTVGGGAARLWDSGTGRLLQIYRSTSRAFTDALAVIDPDRALVIASGSDGFLWFWDPTGQPLWKLQAHKSYVIGLHLEGDDIVTRGLDGDVSRWTLPRFESVIEALHP
jgi:WD40 repeat protein/serine/threonine protein kinase